MDEELKCPYCDGVQREEPDGDWDIELSPWECEHCGKVFWFGRKVEKTYMSWKEEGNENGII